MFGNRIKLFTIWGIPIKLDWSWFIIAVLLVWSLSTSLFPYLYEDLSTSVYWWMGVAGTLGLFASIVLHELGHAVTALRHGLNIRGITLFIFGGVAELEDESPNPKAELQVAIAGPIVSILIALACFGCAAVGSQANWPDAISGVFSYLAAINGILVAFNIIPAFPLDGGRVLRAALWSWKDNLKWATSITSQIGSGFGIALIILGVLSFLGGNFVGGMWWFLLGMFLRHAASISYRQLLLRRALEGEPVERFMQPEVITVPPSITIQEFIDEYLYKYHHKMFPVTTNATLDGCITLSHVRDIPAQQWSSCHVSDVMQACDENMTVTPDADAMQALSRMSRTEQSRMMVVDHGQLVGMITLKDMLKFLALKIELEEGAHSRFIGAQGA